MTRIPLLLLASAALLLATPTVALAGGGGGGGGGGKYRRPTPRRIVRRPVRRSTKTTRVTRRTTRRSGKSGSSASKGLTYAVKRQLALPDVEGLAATVKHAKGRFPVGVVRVSYGFVPAGAPSSCRIRERRSQVGLSAPPSGDTHRTRSKNFWIRGSSSAIWCLPQLTAWSSWSAVGSRLMGDSVGRNSILRWA